MKKETLEKGGYPEEDVRSAQPTGRVSRSACGRLRSGLLGVFRRPGGKDLSSLSASKFRIAGAVRSCPSWLPRRGRVPGDAPAHSGPVGNKSTAHSESSFELSPQLEPVAWCRQPVGQTREPLVRTPPCATASVCTYELGDKRDEERGRDRGADAQRHLVKTAQAEMGRAYLRTPPVSIRVG